MSKMPAISLRSQWLGEKLRAAREQSGFKLRDAGEYLQMDHTTLGRFERGTQRIRRAYVKELIDFYGISDPHERDMLLQLCQDAWRKDWWDGDSSGLEMGFIDFTWLESRATGILAFEPLIVHGLLQTPEYAHALQANEFRDKATSHPEGRTAGVRLQRQRILHGKESTRLSVTLEEPALRRVIGGATIHKEQLKHIVTLMSKPNIDVRVIPADADESPGHLGPFTYFEMPDPYPAIAYIENLAGRTFLEQDSKVAQAQETYHLLQNKAHSPTATKNFILGLAKEKL